MEVNDDVQKQLFFFVVVDKCLRSNLHSNDRWIRFWVIVKT